MTNSEVRRIFVDQDRSADIIFEDLLTVLGILIKELAPYRGADLSGYIELMVTYSKDPLTQTMKTPFLILSCPSVYNCIIGRPTLGLLEAVASTVHLKMKLYSAIDMIIIVKADLDSERRCHFLSLKGESKTNTCEPPRSRNKKYKEHQANTVGTNKHHTEEEISPGETSEQQKTATTTTITLETTKVTPEKEQSTPTWKGHPRNIPSRIKAQ